MNVGVRSVVQIVSLAAVLVVMAGPAAAQDRLIQEERDVVTNATVRVFKTTRGPRIDVETPSLRLRKQLDGNKVITSLSGGGESLVIEFDNRTLTVAGRYGKASAARTDDGEFARVRQLAAKSTLTRRAAALIARMGYGPNSPIQPMLLTTRMFLLMLTDDPSGVREISDWVRDMRNRVTVVRASFDEERTPTECWKEYTKEAVAAWMEFEECMKDAAWWDLLTQAGCTAVYDLRALGAFSWWLDCVKLTSIIK